MADLGKIVTKTESNTRINASWWHLRAWRVLKYRQGYRKEKVDNARDH